MLTLTTQQFGGTVAQLGERPGNTGKVVVVASFFGGAVAQLGARLDGIEEVVGSNPIGSTKALRFSLRPLWALW